MMTYVLWDKITPIYDITPEQAIINNPKYGTEDSYLFLNDDGSIYNLLPLSEIPNPDNLSTPEEICENYIKIVTKPKTEKTTAYQILNILLGDD